MKAYLTISKDREFLYGRGESEDAAKKDAIQYLKSQDASISLDDCVTIYADVNEQSINDISQDSNWKEI